jgi:hypothetical protein
VFRFLKAERRLTELEEALAKLQREFEERDMDWVELRARCRRLLDRTEKAAARVDAKNSVESLVEPNGEAATPELPFGGLTSHQKQIQQQILRRRGGMS